jgi:5-methylcytosine-specific restriction protein A
MPSRPQVFQGRERRSPDQVDRDRGSARERGYTAQWDRASADYRREHPLCEYCAAGAFGPQRVTACTRTDHLYPQRRFPGVFWLEQWWVASCNDCDAAKQALEHQGQTALDRLARLIRRPVLTGGRAGQSPGAPS